MEKTTAQDRQSVVLTIDDVTGAKEIMVTKNGITINLDYPEAKALAKLIDHIAFGKGYTEYYSR